MLLRSTFAGLFIIALVLWVFLAFVSFGYFAVGLLSLEFYFLVETKYPLLTLVGHILFWSPVGIIARDLPELYT